MQLSLCKTAFFTALASYLGFAVVEYLEPGFVSTVFSVHLVGLLALVLGLVWARHARRSVTPRRWRVFLLVLGVGMAIIFWREGAVFAEWRLFASLAVTVAPLLFLKALSARNE